MTLPTSVVNYSQAVGQSSTTALITYFTNVNPNAHNTQFAVGKRWINTLTSTEFILSGFTSTGGTIQANWIQLTGGAVSVQSLTANSGGPVFPTANNINVVGDSTTINIVGNPGTSTLTANVILPAKSHEVLIGEISSISGASPTSTIGVPLISQGTSSDPMFGTALVPGGGTGATAFNINGAVFSGTTTTAALQSATLTSGQLLIGGTTTPAAATLTPGANISITNGNNSIIIASTASSESWVDVTSTSQAMSANTAYTANNASLITFTLPSTAAYGQTFRIAGKGTGLWTLVYGLNQIIHIGDLNTTTTTGSLSSTKQYDCVQLVCSAAPSEFTVLSTIGNLTVV